MNYDISSVYDNTHYECTWFLHCKRTKKLLRQPLVTLNGRVSFQCPLQEALSSF